MVAGLTDHFWTGKRAFDFRACPYDYQQVTRRQPLMTISKIWPQNDASAIGRHILNKVPEVTIYFWIIKVLCTTVGETAADFLNSNLHLGLTGMTFVMGSLLIITLIFQFALKRYVAGIYWLAVVLISIVGTLITDNLTDNFGVSLETTAIVFGVVLAAIFAAWYACEKT